MSVSQAVGLQPWRHSDSGKHAGARNAGEALGGVDIDAALRLEPIQHWSGARFLAMLGSRIWVLERKDLGQILAFWGSGLGIRVEPDSGIQWPSLRSRFCPLFWSSF